MREAVITLSDEELAALGYGELVSLCREAGVREVELLEDHGRGGLAELVLDERLDETVLDELDCLEDWEFVAERDDGYLYLLEVVALNMPADAAEDHEDLIGVCDPAVGDRGLLLSLVGDQETIRDMIRHFQEAGVVPDLHRLGEYDGGERAMEVLTDRQLEVIQTAFDMGFYDIPRSASMDDIAAEVGVDSSTVAEHLQRAERNLLSQQFAARG